MAGILNWIGTCTGCIAEAPKSTSSGECHSCSADKPNKPDERGKAGEQLLRKKMAAEGLSDAFVAAYLQCYKDLVEGKTGMMPEASIEPVSNLPVYEYISSTVDASLLSKTAVLKLNGGLGTSMGLEKAKSLLKVKGEDTFLDFIAKQILYLREQYKLPLRFMLMNSFSTSDDTKGFLQKYPVLAKDPDIELLQNKAPKIDANTYQPASWPKNPELEWCPPGHGDLYAALVGSGKLDKLLSEGVKYMFVSNSDNLGATMDLKILSMFARSGAPMLMEVCERTESDKKGGHLAKDKSGKLVLRESAQCPKEDEGKFQDITRHKFFNTNNLWLNLPMLKEAIVKAGGLLPLPLIRNSKTVDPRDASSTQVYQLETAMGAAIASLPGSQALVVPRARFAPVKSCNDLFALRSDAYKVTPEFLLVLTEECNGVPPNVDLDSKLYKMVDGLEKIAPQGPPSLKKAKKVKVVGNVQFEPHTTLFGEVSITNTKKEVMKIAGTVTGTVSQ